MSKVKYCEVYGLSPNLNKKVYYSNVAHHTIAQKQDDKTFEMFKKHKNNTNEYHNLCIKQDYHEGVIIRQIDNNRILNSKEKKEIFDKCTRRREEWRRSKK